MSTPTPKPPKVQVTSAAGTRSSPRIRTPVDQGAMVNTDTQSFSEAVTLPRSPIPTSKPMATHSKSSNKRRNAALAGTLASLLPDTQEIDEQTKSASDHDLPEDADDDDTQHEHSTAAAAGESSRSARVQWKGEAELELQGALLAYVQKHGRLPAQLKTGKGAMINAGWKEIVAQVPSLKMPPLAAAKACSTKWAKMKKELKVSAHHSVC